ncbi:MAG: hypothetical protein RL059_260 [Bacteroidota bacterium]|jgi:hypothetical protein
MNIVNSDIYIYLLVFIIHTYYDAFYGNPIKGEF